MRPALLFLALAASCVDITATPPIEGRYVLTDSLASVSGTPTWVAASGWVLELTTGRVRFARPPIIPDTADVAVLLDAGTITFGPSWALIGANVGQAPARAPELPSRLWSADVLVVFDTSTWGNGPGYAFRRE